MRTILCFGDSNVFGHIPGSFDEKTGLCKRFGKSQRWPGIVQIELGSQCHVIEEAINGRTTNLDEIIPGRPFRNGLALIPAVLDSHYPIDVIVFMLGTNDTKIQYHRSVEVIAEGMGQLIKVAKSSNKGCDGNPPHIVVIAPQPIIKIPNLFQAFNDDSITKSECLAEQYQQLAHREGCAFLNAGALVSSSHRDGIHLDEQACIILGKAVADTIKNI